MSEEKSSWVDVALEDFKGFFRRFDFWGDTIAELFKDEGQKNLLKDIAKNAFTTSKHKRGEKMTALEFGRIFGHWETQFRTMVEDGAADRMLLESKTNFEKARALREVPNLPTNFVFLIDAFLSYEKVFDPRVFADAKTYLPDFHALCSRIRSLAASQTMEERNEFQRGYGSAIASNSIGPDGLAVERNKKAEFIAILRPRVMESNMNAGDFHSLLTLLLGQNAAGDVSSFSKHLLRREAAVRGKGRPEEKPSKKPDSTKKK